MTDATGDAVTAESAPVRDAVIIVSGLPRSGTSVMMQMLDAGGLPVLTDNVRTPDEDNPRGYYEFEAVKTVKEDPSWLVGAEGKVVKMVYRLLYDLPRDHNYRVVFMLRNLQEVIRSQDKMLQRLGKTDRVDTAQLEQMYRKQIDDIRDWLSNQPNFEVLYVNHRDVIENTDRVVAELSDFLGDVNTEAMRRVPDRSLHRNRA